MDPVVEPVMEPVVDPVVDPGYARSVGPDDHDDDDFVSAMGDVAPVGPSKIRMSEPAIPVPRRTAKRARPRAPLQLTEHGGVLIGRAYGVTEKQLAKLRRGEVQVERELDLHGQRADAVPGLVERVLAEAQAHGKRCVLIIHGVGHRSPGGRGVLRDVVSKTLSSSSSLGASASRVHAFVTPAVGHGGHGATLVLLKKS